MEGLRQKKNSLSNCEQAAFTLYYACEITQQR